MSTLQRRGKYTDIIYMGLKEDTYDEMLQYLEVSNIRTEKIMLTDVADKNGATVPLAVFTFYDLIDATFFRIRFP